jgi:hypothetical protein
MHASSCLQQRRLASAFASGQWQRNTHVTRLFLITEKHPQRLGRDRPPPKVQGGGPWTDSLIQHCDWLPI